MVLTLVFSLSLSLAATSECSSRSISSHSVAVGSDFRDSSSPGLCDLQAWRVGAVCLRADYVGEHDDRTQTL